MGARYTVNEKEPHQTGGSYVARSLHGIPGVVMIVWLVLKAAMLMSIRTQFWIPPAPIAPMYICVPTLVVGLLGIVSNIFYFGPQSKRRPKITNASEPQAISPLGLADRLSRVGNDQWLYTFVTASTTFVLLFCVIYYDRFGEFPWRPLVASPSNIQILQRSTVADLIGYMIGICGIGIMIALCTVTDTVKRLSGGDAELEPDSGSYQMTSVGDGGMQTQHGTDYC